MANNRDNFNSTVIEKLRSRVANKCSNPECRINTTGPKEDEGILNAGIAAHICAAAPGGPRYDVEMSRDERKAFSNGIWLCSNCATIIDRDFNSYPIELLKKWKSDAEKEARSNLGKKGYTKQDTIDTLEMALTGFPKKYMQQSIGNIHAATSQSLEMLDPRFSVTSTFDGKRTKIILNAKQSVAINLTVANLEKNNKEFGKLINTGSSIEIDNEDITISGSPLVEKLFEDSHGKLTLSPIGIPAVIKVCLINQQSNFIEMLDEIHGGISFGRDYLSFDGYCYDDVLRLKMSVPIHDNKGKINIRTNFDKWRGNDVNSLVFFAKINSFFSKVTSGWHANFKLEIKGELVSESHVGNFEAVDFFNSVSRFLRYVNFARNIAFKTNTLIRFDEGFKISNDEFQEIARISDMFDSGIERDKADFNGNFKFIVRFGKENKNMFLKKCNDKTTITMRAKEAGVMTIFGQEVLLPKEMHEFKNVILVPSKKIKDLNDGDEFEVECVPSLGFKYTEKFI